MKHIRNENGVTLVEVLAAMAILAIILTSLINLFPQMGMMNKQNEEKTKGINTAKQLLIEWSTKPEVKDALKLDNSGVENWPSGYIQEGEDLRDYYLFEVNTPTKAKIKIQKEQDLNQSGTERQYQAHQIKVEILNDRDVVVSETYGYVMVRS
ncbi:MAG: type IV pilus modification PilV family protein [Bacillota bacterium]